MSGLECDVVEGCGLSFPQFSHPDPQNPKTLCIKCEALGRDQEVDEGRRGPQIRVSSHSRTALVDHLDSRMGSYAEGSAMYWL